MTVETMDPDDPTAATPADWLAQAPKVPKHWFAHRSHLHGARHTQRVHIHAQRLVRELRWDDTDSRLALSTALWHDIGRTHDGVEPEHGARSVERTRELGFLQPLAPEEAALVSFAIALHSRSDEHARQEVAEWHEARRLAEPERALRILWLLKDADALDRVRLGWWDTTDPTQLRHPEAVAMMEFAVQLYWLSEPAE